MQGVCQNPKGEVSTWYMYVDYCYAGNWWCSGSYNCTLTGPLHGHQGVSFNFQGLTTTYLIFGGEKTDVIHTDRHKKTSVGAGKLSNEVYSIYFTTNLATHIRLITSCDMGGSCPAPRRDAAVSLLGNTGSQNGRLLVFGGLGSSCKTGCKSPIYEYLEAKPSADLVVYNDLWCRVS
eukprot:765270-Hanusia_phi.AAC.7